MKSKQYTVLIVSFLWLFPVFGQLPEVRLLLRELPFAAMADTLRKEGYAPVVQVHDSVIVLTDSSQLRLEYYHGRLCKASMRQATSRAAGPERLSFVVRELMATTRFVEVDFFEFRDRREYVFTSNGRVLQINLQLQPGNIATLTWKVWWVNHCSLRMLGDVPGISGWHDGNRE